MDFIDTHLHLWDLKHLTYAFLLETDPAEEAVLGNYDAIKVNYLIDDYLSDIRGCSVTKAVHVQAALGHPRPVEETAWLQGIADRHGFPHGIIGHCNLQAIDAEQVLDGHAQHANFRGIRMLGTSGMLEDERFQRGFALLGARGLVYDLEASVPDMPAAFRLARRFSRTPIVLEHTGLPMQRTDAYFQEWRQAMRTLAAADNVFCKISGLGMTDHKWTMASLRPWVEAAIDVFSPARCMFGTNWPVDSLYSSFADLVNAYREIVRGYTPDEQQRLLHGTAAEVYRV
jgi:predicted TIM-barrel fold metal-dependent hydrolase